MVATTSSSTYVYMGQVPDGSPIYIYIHILNQHDNHHVSEPNAQCPTHPLVVSRKKSSCFAWKFQIIIDIIDIKRAPVKMFGKVYLYCEFNCLSPVTMLNEIYRFGAQEFDALFVSLTLFMCVYLTYPSPSAAINATTR